MCKEELKAKRYRVEKCVCCGTEWNVSQKAKIPKNGYICPICRNRRDIKKTASGVTAGSGVVLFALTAWMAYIERGYFAIGGEAVFLLMAITGIWGIISLHCHQGKKKIRPVGERTDSCIDCDMVEVCKSNAITIIYHNHSKLSSNNVRR